MAAGTLQFLGFIGITTGTISIFFILFFIVLLSTSAKNSIKFREFHFVSLCFILYILIVGFVRNTEIELLILYSFYILVPLGLNNFFCDIKIYSNKFFNFLIVLAFLQVPVLIVQKIYGGALGKISSKPFAELDSNFGTFPIADDHSLGFFFLSFLGFFLLNDFKRTRKIKWLLVTCIVGLVLINSAISQVLLVLLFGIILIRKLNIQIRLNVKFLIVIIFSIFSLVYFDALVLIAEFFDKSELLDLSYEKASKFIALGTAGRFQTIIYFLNTPTLWIGNGPYSYFNPFAGTFNFNANFSQFIWFYFDLGVFGILIFLVWLKSLKKEMIYLNTIYSNYLLFCFLAYSFFNTTLLSITTLSILFIFHYYQQRVILDRI